MFTKRIHAAGKFPNLPFPPPPLPHEFSNGRPLGDLRVNLITDD